MNDVLNEKFLEDLHSAEKELRHAELDLKVRRARLHLYRDFQKEDGVEGRITEKMKENLVTNLAADDEKKVIELKTRYNFLRRLFRAYESNVKEE
jgi:hypothetical protein